MSQFIFSSNLQEFAKELVWFSSPEQSLKDIDVFLVFVMARGGEDAFKHTQRTFGFTNEDFIRALKSAKPGVFIYEEQWNNWNKKLGINPRFPFPRKHDRYE